MARRNTGPKWYKSRKAYFVTIGGVTHNLGDDQVRANRKYAELTLKAPRINVHATVAELVTAFLQAKESEWKPNSLKIRKWILSRFTKVYGSTPYENLIPYNVTTFRQQQTGWSNGTARIFISSLKACFKWAEEQGLITTNPLRLLKRPLAGIRDDSCLVTEPQHKLMLAASSEPLQDVLDALWHTGNRPGAVLTVEACEVEGDMWVMGDKPGRKLKRLAIYLNEPMQVLTTRLTGLHPTGPMFRNERGNPWQYDTFVHAFYKTRRAAGCMHITPYSYRHSFGRRALDAGVPISDLATLMNTSVAQIEKTYGHRATLTTRMRTSLRMVI